MSKKVRYVLYGITIFLCIASVFIGVYYELHGKEGKRENIYIENSVNSTDDQESVKDQFKDLFTNKFNGSEYDDTNIKKVINEQKIVYSSIDGFSKQEEGKYNIKATLPYINIDSEVVKKYNDTTESVFVNKLNSIMTNASIYTICEVSYTAYINNDILSVAIMASIKEGDNAQRLLVQVYNYNLKTDSDVAITDILNARGLDSNAVNKKIKLVVQEAADEARSVQSTGYNIYERDLSNSMYDVKNVTNFIQGPSGELYIIYAYGNVAFTSEMDIIEI